MKFFYVNSCEIHRLSYFLSPALIKWFKTVFYAYMIVGLNDCHNFIDIFDKWLSRIWCIFDIKITGTESTKLKLRLIGCYIVGIIIIIYIFRRHFRLHKRYTIR